MAPVWLWLGALLAALPVALAGHGDPIAQKYIVEFVDSTTVSQQYYATVHFFYVIVH